MRRMYPFRIPVLIAMLILIAVPFLANVCAKKEMHSCGDDSGPKTFVSCSDTPPSTVPRVGGVNDPHPTVAAIPDGIDADFPRLPSRSLPIPIHEFCPRNAPRSFHSVRAPPFDNLIV